MQISEGTFQAWRDNSKCKGPGVEVCLACLRNIRRPYCVAEAEGEGAYRK